MGTVLVVEDNVDVREMMQILLEDAGYDVRAAANGREALASMRACRPSLVLLDLDMPVMDGWEFRRRQIADDRLSDVPVICVTASCNVLDVTTEMNIRCVAKPVCFDTLFEEVAAACR